MKKTEPGIVRRAGGFTLVEIGVGLVLIALLAGVLIPAVLSRLDSGQAATLASNLNALDEAIGTFRHDVGRYPSQLVYLATAPPVGAEDTCDRVIPNVAAWNGPYLARSITTAGIRSGNSTIQNTIGRDPETFTSTGTMLVNVSDVDQQVAEELERSFDTTVDYAAGAIRWVAVGGSGMGTLTYATSIRGC